MLLQCHIAAKRCVTNGALVVPPIEMSPEVHHKVRYTLKVPAAFFTCEWYDRYLPQLEVLLRVLSEVEIDGRIMLPAME